MEVLIIFLGILLLASCTTYHDFFLTELTMTKNGIIASILLASTITIAGCNFFTPHHQANARLPSRQQLCAALRQQIIFKNQPTGPNMVHSPPTINARATSQYERYNCDEFDFPPQD